MYLKLLHASCQHTFPRKQSISGKPVLERPGRHPQEELLATREKLILLNVWPNATGKTGKS